MCDSMNNRANPTKGEPQNVVTALKDGTTHVRSKRLRDSSNVPSRAATPPRGNPVAPATPLKHEAAGGRSRQRRRISTEDALTKEMSGLPGQSKGGHGKPLEIQQETKGTPATIMTVGRRIATPCRNINQSAQSSAKAESATTQTGAKKTEFTDEAMDLLINQLALQQPLLKKQKKQRKQMSSKSTGGKTPATQNPTRSKAEPVVMEAARNNATNGGSASEDKPLLGAKVVEMLAQSLSMNTGGPIIPAVVAAATRIEAALLSHHSTAGRQYRAHVRMLKSNLAAPGNEALRLQVLSGEISAACLVSMTSAELASIVVQQRRRSTAASPFARRQSASPVGAVPPACGDDTWMAFSNDGGMAMWNLARRCKSQSATP